MGVGVQGSTTSTTSTKRICQSSLDYLRMECFGWKKSLPSVVLVVNQRTSRFIHFVAISKRVLTFKNFNYKVCGKKDNSYK